MVYLAPFCFLYFCAFYWGFCCFKWPLSIVLKCYIVFLSIGKAVMCLTEKIQVLDKLHPDMSYCTVDHKFSKSAIFII